MITWKERVLRFKKQVEMDNALEWALEKAFEDIRLTGKFDAEKLKRTAKRVRERAAIRTMLLRLADYTIKIRMASRLWQRTRDPKYYDRMLLLIEKRKKLRGHLTNAYLKWVAKIKENVRIVKKGFR